MGTWVSDSTLLRWAELTARLSDGALKISDVMDKLLTRPEPERDVHRARLFYLQLQNKECVWTGRPIHDKFAVDHALPFAHWRNNDLWNLLPADERVNGTKSDKLPTQNLLKNRRDCVVDYWQKMNAHEPIRFAFEAEKFIGVQNYNPKNWENALFANFQEIVEITARQRGLERWQPTKIQASGQVNILAKTRPKKERKDTELTIEIAYVDIWKNPQARFVSALPLVGELAAGRPFRGFEIENLSIENEDVEWIKVPKRFCNQKSFIIKVVGDSMETTIAKGDFVVCEYHRHRQAGHDVVIMNNFSDFDLNVEAVKRISENDSHWIFSSDNPKYMPIAIEKDVLGEYPILGIVRYNLSQGCDVR